MSHPPDKWHGIRYVEPNRLSRMNKRNYVIAVEQEPSRFVDVDVSDSNVGDDVDASRQNVSSSQ